MEIREFCVGFILLLQFLTGESRFTYVVTSPKIVRTDTTNTIVVSATGVPRVPKTVHLKLSYSGGKHIKHGKFTFLQDGLQKMEFYIPSSHLQSHDVFVDLDITHGQQKQGEQIVITKTSGYIFIQTDKPIYTPRGTVKYRVLAVNEDQSPTNRPVKVDIISPNGIILERMVYKNGEAFSAKEFHLPKEAELGEWKISASFEDGTCLKTVHFEVEEYILPTFKVFVEASEKIIMKSARYLKININATHTFGKGVNGKCDIRIGVLKNGEASLFNKPYTTQLNKGRALMRVPISDLESSHLWFPEHGTPLYIEVNVTQTETGIMESAADKSSVFATSFYNIDLTNSKKNFKPGQEYRLEVNMKTITGRPKPNLHLYIKTRVDDDSDPKTAVKQCDENGHLDYLIDWIPTGSQKLNITVSEVISLDPMLAAQESKEWIVTPTKLNSISLAKNARNKIHEDMTVKVSYSHTASRTMFILVLAKGQIVYADSFPSRSSGESTIQIPEQYRKELSPLARIVIFFHDHSDIEAESITSTFPSECLEELKIQHSVLGAGRSLRSSPKKKAAIKIRGGPRMRVGLVAVDYAVYFLNDEVSLTRDSLFEQLGQHDKGPKMVESGAASTVFEANNLKYYFNFEKPPVVAHRKFFTPMGMIPNINRAFDYGSPQINKEVRREFIPERFTPLSERVPAKKIRKYFPESWLFEDRVLSSRGRHTEKITLPDTLTTWIVHAVGISATNGVCVAPPIEFMMYMPFFAKLLLPYKAVRLEEVEARVTLYNYKTSNSRVRLNITGDIGLCFPKNRRNELNIERTFRGEGLESFPFQVIPLMTGDLTIRVEVWDVTYSQHEVIDVIEKKLYVVPEGKRLRKTITLALDPEGNHINARSPRRKLVLLDTPTINNTILGRARMQKTQIDLALPLDIIPGTESCGIQACGDLMGDIINAAILGTENIFVSSFYEAEEVIGNLAPAVHALEYLNSSYLLHRDTFNRGKRYITQGVARLMRYRKNSGAFSLNVDSPPATWFTTLVLKTLCHASHISFVDKKLINEGFLWLLDQVDEDGRPKEQENRLAGPSEEYDVMLAAEILIAQKECDMSQTYDQQQLEITLLMFLEDEIENVKSPVILSKMAYAFQLTESPEVQVVVDKLVLAAKRSTGLTYWTETENQEGTPYWYRQGPGAFSIETTAYALLVYLRNKKLDPHPLADWLIRKRNGNGGFVSPSDTAVAIQALAEFSKLKHSRHTDLHLEISSDSSSSYNHILAFTTDNAIQQKQVPDVPVGQKINIKTKGTGFGQMKVKVGYNIPTAPNDNCQYDVTVERTRGEYRIVDDDEISMCRICNFGCKPKVEKKDRPELRIRRPRRAIRRPKFRRNRKQRPVRVPRRIRKSVSKINLCLKICIRYKGKERSGPTNVEIEMLSGYQPIQEDLYLMSKLTNGTVRTYRYGRDLLTIYLDQVPNNESVCLQFRVKEEEIVNFLQPASIVVVQPSKPDEICLNNYNAGDKSTTLPMYCLTQNQRYKGQCTCISGLCGTCPSKLKTIRKYDLIQKLCQSDVVYDVGVTNSNRTVSSKYMSAVIKNPHKVGNHPVQADNHILYTASLDCPCPYFKSGDSVVMMGQNPIRFKTRNNEEIYRYIVDDSTTFLSIIPRGLHGGVDNTTFLNALKSYHGSCADIET